jgi:hypothetical protein
MGISKGLAESLRADLDLMQRPKGYESFAEALSNIKPNRAPPSIKEAPENLRPLSKVEGATSESPAKTSSAKTSAT